jgi:hypothetical protein
MKNVSLPESWDEETEVIVIGSGFAGLADHPRKNERVWRQFGDL